MGSDYNLSTAEGIEGASATIDSLTVPPVLNPRDHALRTVSGGDWDAVILITDGDPTAHRNDGNTSTTYNSLTTQQDVEEAIFSANMLRSQGTAILSVGVGLTGTSVTNLHNISGVKDTYTSANFEDLADELNQIAQRAKCQADVTVQKVVLDDEGKEIPSSNWGMTTAITQKSPTGSNAPELGTIDANGTWSASEDPDSQVTSGDNAQAQWVLQYKTPRNTSATLKISEEMKQNHLFRSVRVMKNNVSATVTQNTTIDIADISPGDSIRVVFVNEIDPVSRLGTVVWQKTDATTSSPLGGSTWKITPVDSPEDAFEVVDNGKFDTDSRNGRFRVEGLPFGLSMAGLLGFAGTANAEPSASAPWATGAPTTGALTLHKLAGATGSAHDGTELESLPSGTTPLEGVTFTATQVLSKGTGGSALDFSLTTGEGWTNMRTADVENDIDNIIAANGYTLGTASSETTDSTGAASFTSLPLGLYLIQETSDGGNNTVAPIEPFLVTIPLNLQDSAGAATDSWLYDVHAYPKNSFIDTPTKSVSAPDSNLNGKQTWTITQPIPTMNRDETIDSFTITDALDRRLVFQNDSVRITLAGTALVSGTDYTMTLPSTQNNNTLTVVFTEDGLAKINDAHGDNLVLTFDTRTNNLGIIDNDAVVNINGAEVTTNKPSTLWGGIEIRKQDGNTQVALEGVEFEVYNSNAEGTGPAGSALTSVTTESDDIAQIGNLWVSNDPAITTRDYWIVETAAAPGYVPDTTPRRATVAANETATHTVVTVNNFPPIIPGLPLTGSAGTMIIMGIGLAFLATAAGLITVARKRRN